MAKGNVVRAALLATLASTIGAGAHAAVVAAPGYAVRTIPTPDPVQGGVVRVGNALFVGQGSFGTGTQTIVRFEGSIGTTVANGFNSLGGFDADGTTLYVVDNCFTGDFCGSPTTGDTVYAIPDAPTRLTSVAASLVEVLPSGSIPTAQDVLAIPGAILVADAAGPGAGRIVKIVGATPTTLVTGLDYLGGLASDGATLFVGNLDGSFVGSVKKFTLAGAPQGTLIGGLPGSYGLARDNDGFVLVTTGFGGTVEAVNALGVKTERAHGFASASDVHFDAARDAALVVDFGVAAVTAICRDANADAICDADCTSPAVISRAQVKIGRQTTPAGDDTLRMKGQMTIPAAFDPIADGARVLVDDATGRVIVDVVVPGGAYSSLTRTGWKANGAGTSWTWKSSLGVSGIRKVKVTKVSSTPGLVKFNVSGRKGGYPAVGAALPVRAVLSLAAAGECGLAAFNGPEEGCAFNATGDRLTCD